jgi:hypothetical protein
MSRISTDIKSNIIVASQTPLPTGQDTQEFTSVNGGNIYSYNQYQYNASNFFPAYTVDLSSFSYFDNTPGKFAGGGVLAPNGNIYCIPSSADYVAIINPYTKTVDTTSIRGLSGGITSSGKWWGGVLAPNGKIYCVPYNSSNILIINTTNNSVSYITGITLANYPSLNTYNASTANDQKWIGGAIAPNGKIYCAPYFARCSLIIDTNNDTINLTDIQQVDNSSYPNIIWRGLNDNAESFGGAVLGTNGNIYFIPCNARGLLQVNPNNNTTNGSSYICPPPFNGTGNNFRFKYFGSGLGPDQNIYIAPWYLGSQPANQRYFLKIDVSKDVSNQQFTNVITDVPVNSAGSYHGVVCGLDGNLYAISNNATNVAIINPVTSTANLTTISGIPNVANGYSGGVLGPDGVIYCIPRSAPTIMTIKTGYPNLQPWMMSPEFNKF